MRDSIGTDWHGNRVSVANAPLNLLVAWLARPACSPEGAERIRIEQVIRSLGYEAGWANLSETVK